MFTGFKSSSSINKTTVSGLAETQLESLQRQVDNYTRKLQQEKKKYFSVQEELKSVTEEYDKQKQKLNKLKVDSSKASNVMLQAKVKNLEANLEKAIGTYDDTLAHNHKLKNQIDMLRREKKNFLETQKILDERIKKYEDESAQKLALIQKKKRKCEDLKNEMVAIKQKNEQEREQYIKQFDNLEKQYLQEKKERESFKFQKTYKPETIDTQPLLKFRLKKIIKSNKEKIKMIEQYKKHMKAIEEAFEEIKLKSGIDSLDEITNTFIQSEEQNYSLYNYMDSLSQNIDSLEDANTILENKIKLQQKTDIERKKILDDTPEEQKRKNELETYIKKKEEVSLQLHNLIESIKPTLETTLKQLAKSPLNENPQKASDYELSMNITDRTIQYYLSDLQKFINNLLIVRQEAKTKVVNSMKDNVTTYSKPIPGINGDEMTKERVGEIREEGKFLEEDKFREYAMEYWEKRKNKAKE